MLEDSGFSSHTSHLSQAPLHDRPSTAKHNPSWHFRGGLSETLVPAGPMETLSPMGPSSTSTRSWCTPGVLLP